MNIQELSTAFAIKDILSFSEGKGGLVNINISNALATASICTYAAQILSYKPGNENEDLLFVSDHAFYEQGKATKGGIPICWPWFGPSAAEGGPGHGFVRASQWDVLSSKQNDDGSTQLILGIKTDSDTKFWPHACDLQLDINVGASLNITLITKNLSDSAITISQALHTYFNVKDISNTSVSGLDGKTYIDKLDEGKTKQQTGDVIISALTDRIYLDVNQPLSIHDNGNNRDIVITSEGSNTGIVWNPWIEQSADMGDFGDEEYKNMICVETANTANDCVTIAASATHRMTANYAITA